MQSISNLEQLVFMSAQPPPGGRVSGARLAVILGKWRRSGPHHGAVDLAAAIELQVHDGRLSPGTRLPSERELTEALGVSRTLVGSAWERLRSAGLIASRRGSGSWITVPDKALVEPVSGGVDGLIDFARASPPAIPGLISAVDAARNRLVDALAGTGYSEHGLRFLRERIAERYTERGLPTTAEQVLVTNGAHNAFVLALRLLVGPGDRVLVEQPSYPNALAAIQAAHALPVPVALDGGRDISGRDICGRDICSWDIDAIEAALRQAAPRLAYLIVDFQNPTGLRMGAEDRARLGAALVRSRTPVVVDETLAELDLEGDPEAGPPPLAAFTRDGASRNWAISIGSASKTYWGGLRIGWIRASEDMIARLVAARAALDLGSPVLDQLVVGELMDAPRDVLRARRAEIAGLRDTLVSALHEYCPQWTFSVPPGGLSLWCGLPGPIGTRLAMAGLNHGVQIVPGSRFGLHGGFERWLRLPYALPAERLVDAVRRLSMAAVSVREAGSGSRADWDVPVT